METSFDTINASNHSNSTTASNKTEKEIYNKLASASGFLVVYATILAFAIVGNFLVCWIVKVNKKMHDVTNYLLVNLAVSDLIQALATIFQVTDFVVKDLNLGNVGCKFQINMVNIPYSSSVLTLTAIAFERYCAVCRPLRFRYVKDRLKWLIPSIWLISFVIYFPTLYYCGSRSDKEDDQLSCDCTYRWPSLQAKNIYGVFIVVVLYAVPLIVVVAFYSKVILRLREAPPGESEANMATYRAKQAVVKMLLVTMMVFFLCWTPYNILYLLKRLEVDYRSVYSYVWYLSLLLAFLSCACNPIIYCFLGKNFREGFRTALCCCRHCRLADMMSAVTSSRAPATLSVERIYLQKM